MWIWRIVTPLTKVTPLIKAVVRLSVMTFPAVSLGKTVSSLELHVLKHSHREPVSWSHVLSLGSSALFYDLAVLLCCVHLSVFSDLCWLGAVLCSSGIWFWEVQSSSWPPIRHSPQQGEEESRAESHWSTVFLLVARSVPLPPLSSYGFNF